MFNDLNYKSLFFKNDDYICFYDSEFNAYENNKESYPQEVISVGLCVVDKKNNKVEDYYSLVKLKASKKVTKRCTLLTNITNKDMKDAKDFLKVFNDMSLIIKKYKINKIYCYGMEDKRAIINTMTLYKKSKNVLNFEKKLFDIREEYKIFTKGKVANQGLQFIKGICLLNSEVKHNALADAVDLSNVTYVLYTRGYNKKIYNKLTVEREEMSNYKKSRNIRDNQHIVAPREIIKAKNKVIKFLNDNNINNLNNGIKRAIIDDLNELLISEG